MKDEIVLHPYSDRLAALSTAQMFNMDTEFWTCLPQEYQEKRLEDISLAVNDQFFFIAHPDLKPYRYHKNSWDACIVGAEVGSYATVENGVTSLRHKRPTPTEQRDAFQKNYPQFVNFIPKKDLAKHPTREKVFGPDVAELPKVIRDQLAQSPLHYHKGKIQPWDFITSQGMSFLEGNIVKYITRYKHKNGVEDLKKARTYLDKLISEVTCVKNSDE